MKIVLILFITIFIISCSKLEHKKKSSKNTFKEAIAVLQPTDGNEARGKVIFTKVDNGVKVIATVINLLPNSQHGFHIHQFGNISGKDGKTAGRHFNPAGHEHKVPKSHKVRHAGDMGKLNADKKGIAIFEKIFHNISLNASKKNSIIGRAVIVHLKKDDGNGATENAETRIAMGVVGISEE